MVSASFRVIHALPCLLLSRNLLVVCAAVCLLLSSGCGKKEATPTSEVTDSSLNETTKESVKPSERAATGSATPETTASNASAGKPTVKGTGLLSVPPLGPLPDVPVPADNPITQEKVDLGRILFFDNRLSGDAGTSCASCHDPRLGWGDGQAISRGYAGTQHWRNSQTTVNSAFFSKLFWAGEVPSLEAQAKSAITGNLAGNGDTVMIEERLAMIPEYVERFQEAFGVSQPTFDLVLKAIASFERAEMISRDSPFDEYLAGDKGVLSEDAKKGLALFSGKARCIACHNGPLMSDEDYHFINLPENKLFEKDPLRQVALRYQHYIRGVPEEVYRNADSDLGLYYTTKQASDRGRFRTPSLRYLEYTAPYMHNGVFGTVEDVIDFYDQGGGDDPKQSPLIQPLNLTEDEKFELAEFLYSLSGSEIRIQTPKLPEYQAVGD